MTPDNHHPTNTRPTTSTAAIDDKIAYHEEMEYIANGAGDFTKAEHHRKMQEIYKAMKERLYNNDS